MTSPTNEQQRVDVLAVMDAEIAIHAGRLSMAAKMRANGRIANADYGVYGQAAESHPRLVESRAAVAELIEAAGEVMHANDESDSARRLRAALANVGAAK